MDMDTYKTIMDQKTPSPQLIHNTKEKMKANITKKFPTKRCFVTVLAAVLLVVFSTTAFAYGGDIINEIKRIMFGGSAVTQVYVTGDGVTTLKIVNRSDFANTGYEERDNNIHTQQSTEIQAFPTYKEASQAAPFHIKEPSWIPENVELSSVNVIVAKNKKLSYDAIINYWAKEPDTNGKYNWITLYQYYAGPDASIEIQTVMSIEKIMIGDIEGSVVKDNHDLICLYRIKDEVVFELQGFCYDLETLVAMAESL